MNTLRNPILYREKRGLQGIQSIFNYIVLSLTINGYCVQIFNLINLKKINKLFIDKMLKFPIATKCNNKIIAYVLYPM